MNPLVPVPRECMTHELANEILAERRSFSDRKEAIAFLMNQGVALHKIEEILDWLDAQATAPEPMTQRLPARKRKAKKYAYE